MNEIFSHSIPTKEQISLLSIEEKKIAFHYYAKKYLLDCFLMDDYSVKHKIKKELISSSKYESLV